MVYADDYYKKLRRENQFNDKSAKNMNVISRDR